MHPVRYTYDWRLLWAAVPLWSKIALTIIGAIVLVLALGIVGAFGSIALGAEALPGPAHVAVQPSGATAVGVNVYLDIIAAGVTLITYLVNHYAPWASEQAKGFFLILVTAATGCVYQAVSSGNFGWNTQTAIAVFQAVLTAGIAHVAVFKPFGISTALGAGTNKKNGTIIPNTNKTLVGA